VPHQGRPDDGDPAEITGPVAITRLQRREVIQSSPQRVERHLLCDLLLLDLLRLWQRMTTIVSAAVLLCKLQHIYLYIYIASIDMYNLLQ
jgi:hypothetical protein